MLDLGILQAIANRVIDQYSASGLSSLAPHDRVFFLIWSYGSELDNGGHAAFFFNSQADNFAETVDALDQLGLTTFSDLLRRAADLLFKGDVPRDWAQRNAALEALPEDEAVDAELDALNQTFFSAGGGDEALDVLEQWYLKSLERNLTPRA